MMTVAMTLLAMLGDSYVPRCVQKLTNSSGCLSSLLSAFATDSGDNRAPPAGQWRLLCGSLNFA